MANIDHHARAERLRAMIASDSNVREDSIDGYCVFEPDPDRPGDFRPQANGTIVLDGETPRVPPRYAATTYDGSECYFEFADTLEDMGDALLEAMNGEVPWSPGAVVDLDTGDSYTANESVSLSPAHLPNETAREQNERRYWRAKRALDAFRGVEALDPEMHLGDLLCDLRHYADKHELDYAQMDRRGYEAYREEIGEQRMEERA